MTESCFISLREFWNRFAELAPAVSPVPLPPITQLVVGLNSYFGNLANHSVARVDEQQITLLCMTCRNCSKTRLDYVCETHVGVIIGTVKRLGISASVAYEPDVDNHNCLITITKISAPAISCDV